MRVSVRVAVAAAAVALAAVAGAANATTFTFQFDNGGPNEPDGTIGAPLVGSGTFTTSEVLTPGLYSLASLPDYSMTYSFMNGDTFSTSDVSTPADGVAVDVTPYGSGLRMVWTEVPGSPDADRGSIGGALDLVGSMALSFEPSRAGGNHLYGEGGLDGGSGYFGNYLALSGAVPEPATWTLLILGVGLIGFAARRRREGLALAA